MDLNWIFNILTSPYMSLFSLFFIGYFCWLNVHDYNDLDDCLTAIGANEATIFIPNQQTINENPTIPANVTLKIIQGGTLNIGKFSIRNATYRWTSSPTAVNEFYLELAAGGDPGIIEPPKVWEDDVVMLRGTLGSLVVGEWNWGDNDTLGYDTVYVRIAASADPDGEVVDYVEAGYKVTVRGNICAGPYQIIEGYGDIDLTYTLTKEIHPEWWGYTGPAERYKSTFMPKTIFTEFFISPDINCHQGYTTDGIYHYCIHTAIVYKKDDDAAWTTDIFNNDPFAGGQPQDHLGDGDYYDGKLYIATERWVDCDDFGNQAIYVFDTSDLTRISINDISAVGHEVAGLVVVPEHGRNGIIYVVSYCDGSKIWKYDLSDFSYLGYISLDITVSLFQGITYRNRFFYIARVTGELYAVDLDGHVSLIFTDATAGEHEGLDYSQDELRWLNDDGAGVEKVHFYDESKSTEEGVKLNEFGSMKGVPSFPTLVRAYLENDQEDIANTTATKVLLNLESYDRGGDFDNAVNYRFTAPYSGYYQVNAAIRYLNTVTDKRYYCSIRRGGIDFILSIAQAAVAEDVSAVISDCVYLDKDDYIELYAYHEAGVGTIDIQGGAVNTFMSVCLIST